MSTVARERAYIRNLRSKATAGDTMAIVNTAEAYRRIAEPDRMFQWFRKAAKKQDGNAFLEIGHCYQFGVGTRVNLRAAERSYRAAIASAWITESGREEAMFFLATLLLSLGRGLPIEVRYLLIRANVEHDYPQAARLLKVLGSEKWRSSCVCRRDRPRQVGALHCPVHNRALANNPVNATVPASRRSQSKRRATGPARYRARWADKR
jgi:TPR repeat protein